MESSQNRICILIWSSKLLRLNNKGQNQQHSHNGRVTKTLFIIADDRNSVNNVRPLFISLHFRVWFLCKLLKAKAQFEFAPRNSSVVTGSYNILQQPGQCRCLHRLNHYNNIGGNVLPAAKHIGPQPPEERTSF